MILLIDIDSTIPNLALKKAEKYYLDRGHEVIWDIKLLATQAEKIYVSCIFKDNRAQAEQYEVYDNALIGGSGYSLSIELSPEIEAIKPRINYGFTTRGCIRKCKFCIVPEKEGKVHVVGDLLDLWDGRSKEITVMDNNILALPDHFQMVCGQAQANKIKVDFNQGLDHRLLTPEICKVLKKTSHSEYRLAYDSPNSFMKRTVDVAIDMLAEAGINRCMWYVLVGFNSTIEEDFQRLEHLRERKQNAYVMRYNKNPEYIIMASWANQPKFFKVMDYQTFKHARQNR
ncbi:hypothetical protein LCGC14_3059580 [marine sediment metagenome]|uniref:Radical SAM core domain-containing protein n=1 Tax=marine sediment metagenome TaxID=412755 RepID=A0A0F8ZA50_9ZZZZ